MLKSKFLTWGGMMLALCAMMFVSSCSKDEETGDGTNSGITPEVVSDGMQTATFTGFVQPDGYGSLMGVTVISGDQTVKTDLNGMYKLDKVNVVGGRAIVKFQKQGYMSVVRTVPFQRTARLDVSMSSCSPYSGTSATPPIINMGYPNQMKVELPANGFVTEAGDAYNGAVKAQAVYLDPDDYDFSNSMPGDLTALRTDNSEAQLVSYGMVAVELTDGSGNKLQLAPGKTATLTFPVPEKFKGGTLPATIPLWSFDESKGLWIEEGAATLNGAGDAYVGTVTHFSWHNLDQPQLRATLKVKVQDNNGGAVPGVLVDIDGQRKVYTNNDGIATCTVPSNTPMYVMIPSEAYGNYTMVYNEVNGYWDNDESKLVKQENVTVAPQDTKTITLTMPTKIPVIKGRVINEGTGSQLCIVWIRYNREETSRVITDYEGKFTLLAPANYTGEAVLIAQYGHGFKAQKEITLTTEDQEINFVTNTSAPAGAGVLQVVGSGLNLRYDLPDKNYENWYVSITEQRGLEVNTFFHSLDGDWGHSNLSLNIQNYTESQTVYTGTAQSFDLDIDAMERAHIHAGNSAFTINVTKSAGEYNFKIVDADAIYHNSSIDDKDGVPVKITVEFSVKEGGMLY